MAQAQVNALAAYSTSNAINHFSVKEVIVSISKAENGYMFHLNGQKKVDVKPTKKDEYSFPEWEHFSATFVYQELAEGLQEVEGFFELIKKQLDKQVKAKESKGK